LLAGVRFNGRAGTLDMPGTEPTPGTTAHRRWGGDRIEQL
jgi:hypothetical protein